MSVLLAAALAGGAAAVLVALPSPGRLRFADLQGPPLHSPVRPVARLPLALAAASVAVAVVAGPVLGLLALAAVLVGQRWRASAVRRASVARERAGAVEACGALAAELRAGRDPASALAAAAEVAAGPLARALAAAASSAGMGGDVAGALRADGTAVPHVLRALAACWTVCAASGSGLAAAVERLEDGLRAEQAQRRALDAELAGPRATAGLLAVLPAFGLLLAAGLGADPLHVLLRTPLGLTCLVLGLALDALGVLWTQRLVTRAAGTA